MAHRDGQERWPTGLAWLRWAAGENLVDLPDLLDLIDESGMDHLHIEDKFAERMRDSGYFVRAPDPNSKNACERLAAAVLTLRGLVSPEGEYSIRRSDGGDMGMGETFNISNVFSSVDAALVDLDYLPPDEAVE